MRRPTATIAWLALCAGAGSMHAATVYRCGHEYTDQACAGAQTLVIASAVSAERLGAARQVAAREKVLAAEMVRDRRAEEAATKPAAAISLSGPPRAAAPATAAKPAAKKRKKNAMPDDERDFIAAVPNAKKAKG